MPRTRTEVFIVSVYVFMAWEFSALTRACGDLTSLRLNQYFPFM